MFSLNVYTVEIYDTTEYYNCLIDLKVFFSIIDACDYIISELDKHVSYRDNYINFQVNEWEHNSCFPNHRLCNFGKNLYNNYKREGVLHV